jgi:perosamine synthetase
MKNIPINKPSITHSEIENVHDAIVNGWGEKCYDYIYKFEKEFANYQKTDFALATSSCTGAIHLALMAMGVTKDDEVIIPEITWIASAEPILYIGAKPIFVDVLEDSWCIDPNKIVQAITKKTKVIIVVHLYGNVANMDEIIKIAKTHNLLVLEDAAEGLGSEFNGRKCGSIGDAGVFSFHGTKTITTGEGGMMVTNNEFIYKKAKILNDHGRNPEDPENKPYWMRDYGYKYKMSNIEAAIGCAQIERIDKLVFKKREIFKWYQLELKDLDIRMNIEQEGALNSYWLPTVIFNKDFNRNEFFKLSRDNGIDIRPFFYPLSSLPMFNLKKENLVAYDIYCRGVNLPSFDDITFDEVKKVCNLVKLFING